MTNSGLLSLHRIVLRSRAKTRQEVLREIGGKFRVPDEVADTFVDALLQREDNYPTGLPFTPSAVALPHADGEHVRMAGLAVCTIEESVEFRQMGSSDQVLPVRLVVCVALPEERRDEQVVLLGRLVERMQDPLFISSVLDARTAEGVLELFRSV